MLTGFSDLPFFKPPPHFYLEAVLPWLVEVKVYHL
jgi:hypothetical protein